MTVTTPCKNKELPYRRDCGETERHWPGGICALLSQASRGLLKLSLREVEQLQSSVGA
jgi:hypothetical protein